MTLDFDLNQRERIADFEHRRHDLIYIFSSKKERREKPEFNLQYHYKNKNKKAQTKQKISPSWLLLCYK
jgi:hypothetical protein